MKKRKNKPLITIITVVRNGEKTLERTIKSVINQTYKNFEYIIIDGISTDGTLNIIKKYDKKIDYWISEPDKGIYDAMNKGVKLANGRYIQFLNADDYFISNNSLKIIIRFLRKDVDIFSCKMNIVDGKRVLRIFPNTKITLSNLPLGKTLAHPATFMKKKVFEELGFFDTTYKISADYNLICECFIKGYKIIQNDLIIVNFSSGGVSSNNFARSLESSKVIKNNFNYFYAFRYYLKNFFPAVIERIFKILDILGILSYLRKLKRHLNI